VRPWELHKTESVDVMDAVGSAIRIDARGREVMQIGAEVGDVALQLRAHRLFEIAGDLHVLAAADGAEISVDVMDAVGSAIRIDARGREVMQIEPRISEEINEEHLAAAGIDADRGADRVHHIDGLGLVQLPRAHVVALVDGLRLQRLDRPFLRENGRLRPASWGEAFSAIAAKVKGADPKRVGALVGDLAGAEEIFALKAPRKRDAGGRSRAGTGGRGAGDASHRRRDGSCRRAAQDRVRRCDGRGRLRDPHRCPRPRGDADRAADQRTDSVLCSSHGRTL
jgi:hypothetical protein